MLSGPRASKEAITFYKNVSSKKIDNRDRDLGTSGERSDTGERDIFKKEDFDNSLKNLKISEMSEIDLMAASRSDRMMRSEPPKI